MNQIQVEIGQSGNGGMDMIKSVIGKLSRRNDIGRDEMAFAMEAIMDGRATDAQIGAFLAALSIKGETADEIFAGASVMRKKAVQVDARNSYCIDTCGTGGDGAGTFNVSTAVMFVASAAGVKVVKHGNRSVSSRCGSADVLEALGANIELGPAEVEECVRTLDIGFMFAPKYHTAMKNVMPARQQIGMRTVFNILGPLSNPASVKGQVLGVFDERLLDIFVNVLRDMGAERAMVVHGEDGLDEISISGRTLVRELREGQIISRVVCPEDFGLRQADASDIMGGDSNMNAGIIREILGGQRGAKRDMVVLNAAAAIYVGKKADSMHEGVMAAKHAIDSGLAMSKLESFVQLTRRLGDDSSKNS